MENIKIKYLIIFILTVSFLHGNDIDLQKFNFISFSQKLDDFNNRFFNKHAKNIFYTGIFFSSINLPIFTGLTILLVTGLTYDYLNLTTGLLLSIPIGICGGLGLVGLLFLFSSLFFIKPKNNVSLSFDNYRYGLKIKIDLNFR